jgi:serine/threonine-protein kinase RIO1
MLKIDKKTIQTFLENDIKKIKVFFYEAGCS